MLPKDQFDACMKQAEFFSERVRNRQTYQWKITIGLWTVLLVSTGFLFDKQVTIPRWFGPLIFVCYTFIWVRAVALRNHRDHAAAHHFRREAEMILTGSKRNGVRSLPDEAKYIKAVRWCFQFLIEWANVFEVATTGFIIWVAYSLFGSR